MFSFLKKKICNALSLEKRRESAKGIGKGTGKGTGRELGMRKGNGKTQDFVHAEEKELEKHSIFNHARERELEKHSIFNHARERELEKHSIHVGGPSRHGQLKWVLSSTIMAISFDDIFFEKRQVSCQCKEMEEIKLLRDTWWVSSSTFVAL